MSKDLIGPLAAVALLLGGCAGSPEPAATDTSDAAAAGEATTAVDDSAATAAESEGAGTPDAAGEGPAASANGLGLSEAQIIGVLAEGDLSADAFSAQTLDDGRRVLTASFPETSQRQVLWIAILGEPAAPHTVRADFYPNNAEPEEVEAVGLALDRLLMSLFPDWPEVVDWPEVAGRRAWEETIRRNEGEEGAPREVPVLETVRDGIALEALGVPPQIVSYVFTTNETCRPSKTEGFYQGYAACR